jgi:SAM-dependent methyltransferase
LRISLGPDRRVLDIGCGTGDITEALAGHGATAVGYDISSGVIELARARFSDRPNVVLECANIVDAEIRHGPFDLITSVTVLQHQVIDESLGKVLGKLSDALKPGGTILILETVLPEGAFGRGVDHYTRPRTRTEWLEAFEKAGLRLAYERSYPQNALATLGWIRRVVRRYKPAAVESATAGPASPDAAAADRLRRLAMKGYLKAFVPVDHWLRVPTPKAAGGLRILAFRAVAGPGSEDGEAGRVMPR